MDKNVWNGEKNKKKVWYVYCTIFIGLYDGLITLFPSLRISENHFQADVGVGRQVAHQVARCWEQKWGQHKHTAE